MITLTFAGWNRLIDEKKILDISHELPDSFMMYGQVMRAKIILDGKKYYASGWVDGVVHLTEVEQSKKARKLP